MAFIPHTPGEVEAMLQVIGAQSIDDLFDEIPANLLCAAIDSIPSALNEAELSSCFRQRALSINNGLSFLGGGAYHHHIPAAVWDIAQRGEFYTAYTPYQAEASQGALQTIYEFQTMMARLLGMDVVNASMYDGATALSEAALMAIRLQPKRERKILLPANLHPYYRQVVHTICRQQNIECVELPFSPQTAQTDLSVLAQHKDAAACIINNPNFFGVLENVDEFCDAIHEQGMLVIGCVNPIAAAMVNEPGSWGRTGADIVCGEGQPLGIPLASGGPYFGFFAARKQFVRQMPGRIVGMSVDAEGREGFTLTLQAREQHIRRSKATSNICTNQGLMVTAATVYLAMMGANGLRAVAERSHGQTVKLVNALSTNEGVRPVFSSPYFHEVALTMPGDVAKLTAACRAEHIHPGIDVSEFYPECDNALLLCATELTTDEDIERLVSVLQRHLP